MKHRQVFVYDFDEVVVHFFRDIAAGKGSLACRAVFSDSCGNHVVLSVIVVVYRDGIDEFFISLVHIGKCSLTDVAVVAFHEGNIVSVS